MGGGLGYAARMVRGFLLVGLTVGLTAAGPSPTALERAGWTLVTASDDTWVYMKHHANVEDGVRQAWTAYDSDNVLSRDGFKFRSVESLGEFDCKRRQTRVLHEIYHDQPALQGRSWKSPKFIPTPWAAPQPGSVGAIRMAFACRALVDT